MNCEEFTLDDGRVRVQLVALEALREVWPEVVEGLECVREANGELWIPEDVYSAVSRREATLYTFRRDGELIGLQVFQRMTFPFDPRPALNIWVGWAKYPKHGWLGLEAAKRVARGAGLGRVVFSTTQDSPWVNDRFQRLHAWYEVK